MLNTQKNEKINYSHFKVYEKDEIKDKIKKKTSKPKQIRKNY